MPKVLKIMSWKDVIQSRAKSPMKFGKPIKRKCLCIGKNYYWKDVATDSWDNHPELAILIEMKMGINVLDKGVSVLINVYEDKDHNIGYHIDKPDDLISNDDDWESHMNDIFSMSYAINDSDIDKDLGTMTYKYGEETWSTKVSAYGSRYIGPIENTHKQKKQGSTEKYNITNGRVFAWNGVLHNNYKISHKARTLVPRINITVRLHKEYEESVDWGCV